MKDLIVTISAPRGDCLEDPGIAVVPLRVHESGDLGGELGELEGGVAVDVDAPHAVLDVARDVSDRDVMIQNWLIPDPDQGLEAAPLVIR